MDCSDWVGAQLSPKTFGQSNDNHNNDNNNVEAGNKEELVLHTCVCLLVPVMKAGWVFTES